VGLLLVGGVAFANGPTPKGPYVPPPSRLWPRVEVICIDTASIHHYHGYPFDRALYARLLDKLVAAGARTVGFDLYFGSPRTAAGDQAFARAIARSRRAWLIVDPVTANDDMPKLPMAMFAQAAGWRIASPALEEGMHFIGGVSMKLFGRAKIPQLLVGLMADYLHLRRWPYPASDGDRMYVGSWVMPAPGGVFTSDSSDTRRLSINKDSRVRLHSFWKVLQPGYPMAAFKDAIVLVGTTPSPRNGEELIFEDWSIPSWVMKSHVEACAILVEKMIRYLDRPRR
jgi:hypothetical protein